MTADIDAGAYSISTNTGAPATLRLNGHTLTTGLFQVQNGKELTIEGGSENAAKGTMNISNMLKLERCKFFSLSDTIVNGRISDTNYPYGGDVVLENVTANYVEGNSHVVSFRNSANVTLTNVEACATGNAYSALHVSNAETVSITGGRFEHSSTTTNSSAAVDINSCGEVSVEGVTAVSTKYALKADGVDDLTVSGGSFTSTNEDNSSLGTAAQIDDCGSVTICDDAEINGPYHGLYVRHCDEITIEDAVIESSGNSNSCYPLEIGYTYDVTITGTTVSGLATAAKIYAETSQVVSGSELRITDSLFEVTGDSGTALTLICWETAVLTHVEAKTAGTSYNLALDINTCSDVLLQSNENGSCVIGNDNSSYYPSLKLYNSSVTVDGAEISGSLDSYESTLVIEGGVFAFDPTEYVDTENFTITEDTENGTWTVSRSTDTDPDDGTGAPGHVAPI